MKSVTKDTGVVTVAAIRRPRGRGPTQYLFNERQRIFTMPSTTRKFEASVKLLKTALRKNAPLKVVLDARRGRIERVEEPLPQELRKFRDLHALLENPDRPLRLDVAKIDPSIFNVVDYRLRWKAKEIFDFCAKQSCHLPGPYDISPCIPFQYVVDGCYARAHKMRWIITTKYHYCCEKVFSFANQNADTLAVKADKWGGYCVCWWYHVAPLVRVSITIPPFGKLKTSIKLTLAMVIDPGMFDKPVLLSTWLSAQENKNCSANAKVSMYSIQPGSAYWPANYQGTLFGTDDTYAQTDATLTNYRNGVTITTCP